MISDDELMGVERPDPTVLKPLKVRLPLGHVLQLHRMRIMGNQTVSEIVTQALEDYLVALNRAATQRRKETEGPIDL